MTFENAIEASELIRSKYAGVPRLAIVLGSGLGAFADDLDNAVRINYTDIPHFARSTVEGHAGQLVLGEIDGVSVAVQQGRFHYYEGYEMEQVMFPMRVFGRMGIESVILTNAAGSLDPDKRPGSLMLISDHINMMGLNPLRGQNDERFGVRFPDMTEVYDRRFQEIAVETADRMAAEQTVSKANGFLHRGVYCALSGPTYETPAEIRMLRHLGADAVGMSTVPEAIAARHQGMSVLGISCITNFAAGMVESAIDHSEVMETGARVADVFKEMLRRIIREIA
ncbi:purine-nucleoside phosphorylase [soil metagenome]